ncbi:hypothetical protein EB796_020348 [Bugula neritina]|uniref:SRCR domain-containing protein n=1 Tax=Bugula neritina TaxID=10212 RepID=A0A7J7J7E2_BUGNE|nr:hypothetical protein EB796_020348 [Bugula neritina]
MRIVDGSNAATGRVEVQRNGVWGTVCNNGFDYLAARVVCAGLCFDTSFAKPYYPRAQAPTTTPASSILMDNLRCDGTEYNLLNCSHTQSNLCQHSDDARVSCVDLPDSPPQPPAPDLVCREKDMEVAFNKTIHPSLQIDDLSQFEGDPGCTPARGSNSTFVTISLPYSTCASLNSSNDSHIIYSVNIKYDLLVPGNLLTRLHIFKIPAYCLFPRLLDASVPFRPVTQTAPPVIGGANFDVDMFIYQDDSFQTPVASYPHNITLGQYLNTAVVLNSDDTSLKQVVSDCWATTDDNSSSAPTYELIKDK